MSPRRISWLIGGMFVSLCLVAIHDEASAQRQLRPASQVDHDGVYAVQIVTERGTCDRSYNWTITISGGRISSTGNTPLAATGEISPKGVVTLAFRGFNEVAHVNGRLKGNKGSGTWVSPTLDCGGTWRALRQS